MTMHATQDVRTITPSPRRLIARARALIPVLAARAAQAEQERRIPHETIADMQAAGLFRVFQPKRWGGYEMDPATYFEIQLALGEGVHVDRLGLWRRRAASLADGRCSTTAPRRSCGARTTPTLVCSSLMPTGTAIRAPGGFRLAGAGSSRAAASTAAGPISAAYRHEDGKPGDRSIFLVPRSDYEIEDTWHVSGLKATGSHDIVVKDAFVPDYRRLRWIDNFNGVGPGQAVNTSSLYRWMFGQIFFRGVSTAPRARCRACSTRSCATAARGLRAARAPWRTRACSSWWPRWRLRSTR